MSSTGIRSRENGTFSSRITACRCEIEYRLTGPSEAMDGRSEPTGMYLRRVPTSDTRFGTGLNPAQQVPFNPGMFVKNVTPPTA